MGRISFGSKLKIIATGAALWMTTVAKTMAESLILMSANPKSAKITLKTVLRIKNSSFEIQHDCLFSFQVDFLGQNTHGRYLISPWYTSVNQCRRRQSSTLGWEIVVMGCHWPTLPKQLDGIIILVFASNYLGN